MQLRHDIQGLRAVAIALVVSAHAGVPLLAGGFVGVDVFFVLSGYLITDLLMAEHRATGSISLAKFYARRLRRLLPALLAVVGLTLVSAAVVLTSHEATVMSGSALYAVSWTSNLYFALSAMDYFAALQERDLFLHTWSLGVEEQFYLMWPLLILALAPRLRWQEWRGWLAVFALLFVASLALSVLAATRDPMWAFYMMPTRVWQFSLGGIVALGGGRTAPLPGRRMLGAVGFALILGSAVLLPPQAPGYWLLFPSIGAALVIADGQAAPLSPVSRLLAHPLAGWVGDRSYSWYLWHWPVLTTGFTIGVHGFWAVAGLVAASLALADQTHRWVERPLWKGTWVRSTPPRVTILASGLAVLVMINAVYRFPDFLPAETLSPDEIQARAARRDAPALYSRDCDAFNQSASVSPCIFGSERARGTVVLLGDSIGVQWFPVVTELFKAPEWRTVVLTKSACPMVDKDFFYKKIRAVYHVCTQWRGAVLDYLDQARPDVIILGSSAEYEFSPGDWVDGSARVLGRLSAAAGRVWVVAGTPGLSFDGPSCLEHNALARRRRSAPQARACVDEVADGRATAVAGYLQEAARKFRNVELLDLNDAVCPRGLCAARAPGGAVVFRDDAHLTATYALSLAASFDERMRAGSR